MLRKKLNKHLPNWWLNHDLPLYKVKSKNHTTKNLEDLKKHLKTNYATIRRFGFSLRNVLPSIWMNNKKRLKLITLKGQKVKFCWPNDSLSNDTDLSKINISTKKRSRPYKNLGTILNKQKTWSKIFLLWSLNKHHLPHI